MVDNKVVAETLLAEHSKFQKEANLFATASFFGIYDTKKDNTYTLSGGCHAALSSYGPNCIGILSNYQTGYRSITKKDLPDLTAFIDYLCNRSHFAECFIHPEQGEREKYVGKPFLVHTDVPSNLMAGALCATRACWEKPEVPRTFRALCEAGVEEHRAFVLAYCFRKPGDEYYYSGYGVHTPFQETEASTFFRYTYNKKTRINKNFYKNSRYHGMDDMWRSNPPIGALSSIIRDEYEKRKSGPKVEVNYNPFKEALEAYERRTKKATAKNNFTFKVAEFPLMASIFNSMEHEGIKNE